MSSPQPDPAASGALSVRAAERAQLTQLQSYVAHVSGLFETVVTDLLLEQPEDPHAFLLARLEAVPVADRAALRARIIDAEDAQRNNWEAKGFNRAKEALIVVLTLTLNEGEECKATVLDTLAGLQKAARTHPACLRYDVCHNPRDHPTEVLINQQWASQAGLDEFYASPEFQQATPKFKGQLAGPPDERVYHPV
jgi:quinol monooxygenase YgiN